MVHFLVLVQYDDIIARLSKLAENPLSEKIKDFLDQYRRSMFVYRSHANIPKLDEEGKVKAIGKRKTSTAEVTAVKGSGEVNINGRQFIDYFPRLEDRQQVLYPLVVTDQLGLYDIRVKVKGGGITGVCISVCVCVCVHVCMYVCECMCVYLCVHTLSVRYLVHSCMTFSCRPGRCNTVGPEQGSAGIPWGPWRCVGEGRASGEGPPCRGEEETRPEEGQKEVYLVGHAANRQVSLLLVFVVH